MNDPKKKKRWMDRINWQKATNRLKATKRQTGQKFFDFNQGGEIVIGKNVDKDLL